jgi:hypothetical protein
VSKKSKKKAQAVEVAQVAPKIELEATLTVQDITDIVVSENEEKLLLQREQAEDVLAVANAAHRAAEKSLTDQAEKVVKKMKADKDSVALAAALNEFHGTKKRFTANVPDDCVSVHIEKKNVVGRVKVDDDTKSSYSRTLFSKEMSLPFTANMQATVRDIAAKAKEVEKAAKALTQIRRMLTDLPRLQRRAKSELTKAQLRGELGTGQAILDTVMGAQSKALPYNGNQ